MTNFEKIKQLYILGISKDEVLNYVKTSKITPQISIDYTPLFTFDSNNNIIYCVNNTIYKIPAIENTNSYHIFKGYKLKSV